MKASYIFWFAMGAMLSMLFELSADPHRAAKLAERNAEAMKRWV